MRRAGRFEDKVRAQAALIRDLQQRLALLEVASATRRTAQSQTGETPANAGDDSPAAKIIALIQQHGGRLDLSNAGVADAIGSPRTTTRDAINRLTDAGVLKRDAGALVLASWDAVQRPRA